MGNQPNHVKEVGIQPQRTISRREYAQIWQKYDKNKNRLTFKQAQKFMKDFSESVGVAYDKDKAQRLITDADKDRSGYLDYEEFKKLFFAASKSANMDLTTSLKVELNAADESSDDEADHSHKIPLNLSSMKVHIQSNSSSNSNTDPATAATTATPPPLIVPPGDALDALFQKYRELDTEEDEVISGSGTLKYLEDLGITSDTDPTFILIAWKLEVNQPSVWQISKSEFKTGWQKFSCKTVDQMKKKAKEWSNDVKTKPAEYKLFYFFVFDYLREAKKILSVEEAVLAWNMLEMNKRWPMFDDWAKFINDRGAVTRDTWRMFLQFTLLNPKNLTTYTDDGCWPTVIDEFVDHMKKK